MKKFSYVIQDEIGIHARPAGLLVQEAKKYESKIMLLKEDRKVDATKLIGLMGLGVKCGETVEIEISGADEESAYDGIKTFFDNNL